MRGLDIFSGGKNDGDLIDCARPVGIVKHVLTGKYRTFINQTTGVSFVMKFFAILLSLFLAAPALAADNTDRHLAIEYLTLTQMESVVNATLKEYDDQLLKNAPPNKRAELRAMLEDSLGWNATKDQLADLVANLYTKEELKAYIAFIKTPAGKSFNDKNTEFSRRYSTFASENIQRVLQKCCSQQK